MENAPQTTWRFLLHLLLRFIGVAVLLVPLVPLACAHVETREPTVKTTTISDGSDRDGEDACTAWAYENERRRGPVEAQPWTVEDTYWVGHVDTETNAPRQPIFQLGFLDVDESGDGGPLSTSAGARLRAILDGSLDREPEGEEPNDTKQSFLPESEPTLLFIYIVGSTHDGSLCDNHVRNFRRALEYLALRGGLSDGDVTPNVRGLLVGWRGEGALPQARHRALARRGGRVLADAMASSGLLEALRERKDVEVLVVSQSFGTLAHSELLQAVGGNSPTPDRDRLPPPFNVSLMLNPALTDEQFRLRARRTDAPSPDEERALRASSDVMIYQSRRDLLTLGFHGWLRSKRFLRHTVRHLSEVEPVAVVSPVIPPDSTVDVDCWRNCRGRQGKEAVCTDYVTSSASPLFVNFHYWRHGRMAKRGPSLIARSSYDPVGLLSAESPSGHRVHFVLDRKLPRMVYRHMDVFNDNMLELILARLALQRAWGSEARASDRGLVSTGEGTALQSTNGGGGSSSAPPSNSLRL